MKSDSLSQEPYKCFPDGEDSQSDAREKLPPKKDPTQSSTPSGKGQALEQRNC